MKSTPPVLPSIFSGKMASLQNLCSKHRVKRLWAFGSVMTEAFHEGSDIDFLYELDRTQISEEFFLENFFGFYDSLKSLFDREIDLIKYKAIHNPYFLAELEETKLLLYDQSREEVSI